MSLVWTPIANALEERIRGGDDVTLIFAPFAKLDALKQLHWTGSKHAPLKLVCRWRPEDLLSGVSDLEVFGYLKEHGCQLYIHPEIHLKLYIFESNDAFNTSGNLTMKGLGYSPHSNIEVGNMVGLTVSDWAHIYRIIAASRQMDDVLYLRFKALVDAKGITPAASLDVSDLFGLPKRFTISSLPAVESPARLREFYLNPGAANISHEQVRRAMHDIVVFDIPEGLAESELMAQLGEAFRKTPFVLEFLVFLKSNGSLRFGAVNDWIHQKCEDVPLPYRWEIKDNTRIFYNWLAHYFAPNITWDVPGSRSQVIYWKD